MWSTGYPFAALSRIAVLVGRRVLRCPLGPVSAALGVNVEADEVVSHDTKHAIANFAASRGVDTVVVERGPLRLRSRLLGGPIHRVGRHAPCDVLLVDTLGYF